MAADARWLKVKSFWQGLTRDKRDRVLGLLFIVAVAFIWVCSSKSSKSFSQVPHPLLHRFLRYPMHPGFAGPGILPCPRPRGRGPQSIPADIHSKLPLHCVSSHLCPHEAAHSRAEGQASSYPKFSAFLICLITFLCCACHTCSASQPAWWSQLIRQGLKRLCTVPAEFSSLA